MLCEAEVLLKSGGIGVHYVMADCFRRMVCLGAGELTTEWLAGLIRFEDAVVKTSRADSWLIESCMACAC